MNSANSKAKKDMADFVMKTRKNIDSVVAEILKGVGAKLVDYSVVGNTALWKYKPPKGYIPGHFINNWQMGPSGSVSSSEIPGEDASGGESLSRMQSAIPQAPADKSFTYVNNVPYAFDLEYGGHSTQVPPGGMVGKVVLEFPQIVRDARDKVVKGL